MVVIVMTVPSSAPCVSTPQSENTSGERDFVDIRRTLVLCVPPLIPLLEPLLELKKAKAGHQAPDEYAHHQ